MKIGIDATAIPPNRLGAGNYIFNLVAGLAHVDATNHYVVFAKPEHITEWAIDRPNFRFIAAASRWRPLRLAWEQIWLPLLIKRHGIDVWHSPHYTIPVLAPCRVVVTVCDMIFFLYPEVHGLLKRIFFRNMIRIAVMRARAVITISKSTADDLNRILHVDTAKINTVLLAADQHFRPVADPVTLEQTCERYGLVTGKYILYVGALEPRKNIPLLLRAYRELIDGGIQERLAIVGRKGWMYGEIFEVLRSLRLEKKVIFTGYVPDRELADLYRGARVFVYPSVYEGFGLPVLEAMSCGTPVVTSEVSSMPEIVGDAGILVNPQSLQQLTEAIRKVIVDDSLHRALQIRGLERAAQFSWEKTARGTLQVYQKVLGGQSC